MITCPWCGTTYPTFQSICSQCGGALPAPAGNENAAGTIPPEPLPSPRNVPPRYITRLLSTDGWAITAGVLTLLGLIFTPLGLLLILFLITAPVGLPFMAIGLLFLAVGLPIILWRYRRARQQADIFRLGQPTLGRVVEVYQNLHVRINRRHPWIITYQFQATGRDYQGQMSILQLPLPGLQPGQSVRILYMEDDPQQNILYLGL
jgi:hypothetical protein